MRVGLYGGSFDPVHNAHLALARSARDALALDEVRWIPAGQPWQKPRAMTAAVHREAMLRLALDGERAFLIDRIELERAGPTYTLETVRALSAALPGRQWFLIVGADQYRRFDTWHGWQELLERVVLAVANRPGEPVAEAAGGARFPHVDVPLPMLDIASSDVRDRVARRLPIADLVPPDVARYIDLHGLYQAPAADRNRS